MNKTLRIVLAVVGVLVVVVLVAPFLIPVNQFRPTIEEKASAALGRKVQLGNISLSLISGSLSAENLSPRVTLLHNAAGQWNYSSLGASAARAQAKQAPVEKPSPTAGAAEVAIKKLTLSDGSIIVGSTSSQKRSTYDHVNVTASDVSLTSKFPVTITADLPAGGKLKLDGTFGPVDQVDTALTPLNAKLNVTGLNLASTGFLDPSMGLGGIVDLDANLSSQGGEAETKGNAKLSKALLIAGGSSAGVPVTVNFATKYNLRKNSGVLNPSTLNIGSAVAHLSGTFQSPGDETIVNAKVEGENMPARDLEAFLPALGIHLPKGASLAAGALNTNLNITGPTNKLITTGTVGLYNAKLAGFDLGSRMSTISALTGLKTGQDLDIEKVTTKLHMAPSGLEAENFLAVIPALGTLVGAGTVDSKNALDFKMAATLANSATYTSSGGAPASGIGGILGAIGGGKGGCKGATIPFQIHGTTAEPKFVPDIGGTAASLLESQLGCAGGAASGVNKQQQTQNPADAINALSGLFKKKKP